MPAKPEADARTKEVINLYMDTNIQSGEPIACSLLWFWPEPAAHSLRGNAGAQSTEANVQRLFPTARQDKTPPEEERLLIFWEERLLAVWM